MLVDFLLKVQQSLHFLSVWKIWVLRRIFRIFSILVSNRAHFIQIFQLGSFYLSALNKTILALRRLMSTPKIVNVFVICDNWGLSFAGRSELTIRRLEWHFRILFFWMIIIISRLRLDNSSPSLSDFCQRRAIIFVQVARNIFYLLISWPHVSVLNFFIFGDLVKEIFNIWFTWVLMHRIDLIFIWMRSSPPLTIVINIDIKWMLRSFNYAV